MRPGSSTWSKATWDDKVTRLKFRRALVWPRIAPPTKHQPRAAQSTNQPTAPTRAQRHTGPVSNPAQPGGWSCATYSQGLCFINTAHPTEFQCAVFVSTPCRGSVTTQSFTSGARFSHKNWAGRGLKQVTPPSHSEDNPTPTACQTLQQVRLSSPCCKP